MFCLAWAVRVRNAKSPKLEEARDYFQKACDGGVQHGCTSIPNIDQQIRDADAQTHDLWSSLVAIGDDLVQKTYATEILIRYGRNTRALPRIRAVTQATLTEQYCPAKKAFVTAAGTGEFQRMASTHCKEQAPTSGSPTGDEVILTRQCQQVFATGCP
jgi:hypothetical protein